MASKWGRLNIVEYLVNRGAYKECKTRVSAAHLLVCINTEMLGQLWVALVKF